MPKSYDKKCGNLYDKSVMVYSEKLDMATRLDRNMKVNRHKTMAMEYFDEQAALEAEQTKEQQAEASQEAELLSS
jgi:hypothetical protein